MDRHHSMNVKLKCSHLSPDQMVQLVGVSSYTSKGFRVQFLVGGTQEATY